MVARNKLRTLWWLSVCLFSLSLFPLGAPAVAAQWGEGGKGDVELAAQEAGVERVYTPHILLYAQDFDASDGGFVSSGSFGNVWQHGFPAAPLPGEPPSDHTGAGGDLWGTGLGATYPDNADEYVTSPIIDLSGTPAGESVMVTWWEWRDMEGCCDYLYMEVSTDGVIWDTVYGGANGNSGGWVQESALLSGATYGVSTFQMRYRFDSDLSVTYTGAYIDDIEINSTVITCTVNSGGVSVYIPGTPVSVYVGDDGSYQILYDCEGQIYPGSQVPLADAAFFAWAGADIIAPDFGDFTRHPISATGGVGDTWTQVWNLVGQSALSGSGTPGDPYMVTTNLDNTATGVTIDITTSYVNPDPFFSMEWTICNADSVFLAADLYLEGSDSGYGYYDPGTGAVGGMNAAMNWYEIIGASPVPATAYMEDTYFVIWDAIGNFGSQGTGFTNTISETPPSIQDNGAGLQWDLGPGCTTLGSWWSFGTTPALPVGGFIEGVVELQGRTDFSGVTIEAWAPGPILAGSDVTDATGAYSINVPADTYTVTAEMPRYLDGSKSSVLVTEGNTTTLPDVRLLGGDTDDNEVIEIFDLTLVAAQFYGTCPTYDARADINDNCLVNVYDFTITGGNYTKQSIIDITW